MMQMLKVTIQLRYTYVANQVLYFFKRFPLLGKALPRDIYGNPVLKMIATVLGILYEFSTIFYGKVFYFLIFFVWVLPAVTTVTPESFAHLFFFSTLVGCMMNTQIFNPTKDKYYAVYNLKADAKSFAITGYVYYLGKTLIGFSLFSVLAAFLTPLPIWLLVLFPLFVTSAKILVVFLSLLQYVKMKRSPNENKLTWVIWLFCGICLTLGFGLPAWGFTLPLWVIPVATAVLVPFACLFGLRYILHFKGYRDLYRLLFSDGSFLQMQRGQVQAQQMKMMQKNITYTPEQGSDKSGYQFFNELFFKRHHKIFKQAVTRISLIMSGVFLLGAVVILFLPQYHETIQEVFPTFFPLSIYLLYLTNRSSSIAQVMFMNCDHSLLTYNFYRQRQTLLSLFVLRLRSLILLNLVPALIAAIGFPLLLFVAGGAADWTHYLLMALSVLSMSVFFTVYYLGLYYLLQPFNLHAEIKNPLYYALNIAVSYLCLMVVRMELDLLQFTIGISAFSILFIALLLPAVFLFAPKTFKLKQ